MIPLPSWPGLSRPSRLEYAIAGLLLVALSASPALADTAFQTWLQSLWPQAQALGVSRATFDAATRGLEPDLTLPDLVLPGRPERPSQGQAEFVQTPADYLKEPSIEQLAAQGRKLLDQYRALAQGHLRHPATSRGGACGTRGQDSVASSRNEPGRFALGK